MANGLQHASDITSQQGDRVEPESRKDFAALKAILVERESFVLAGPQHKPVEGLVPDAPNDVLANAVPPVDVQLHMQIVTDGTGRDLDHQFGSALNVTVLVARLPAVRRQNSQVRIGLRFVVEVQPQRRVVATLHARRHGAIDAQPSDEFKVRNAMIVIANG